jgi:hypothetical protein
MTPCNLVGEYQHFGGARCLPLRVTLSWMMEYVRRWRRVGWTWFCCVFVMELCHVERKMCLFNGTLISFWEFTRSFKWSVCVGVATQYEMSGLNATAPIPNPTRFFHLRFPHRCFAVSATIFAFQYTKKCCRLWKFFLHNMYNCTYTVYTIVLAQLTQLHIHSLYSCTYTTYVVVHRQFIQLDLHNLCSCTYTVYTIVLTQLM